MLKEIAASERARITYTKLKQQSDKLLMNLNIRTERFRPRVAVSNPESSDDESCASPTSDSLAGTVVEECAPAGIMDVSKSNEGFSLIVMCHPCDTTDKDSKEESFREATGSLATQAQSNTKFIRFKQRLCVCGKCTLPESKAVGPFRSVAMLLRGTSSVVVIRNGGLVGMWQGANSGKLSEFIMKYV
jgi:hypothetical protein